MIKPWLSLLVALELHAFLDNFPMKLEPLEHKRAEAIRQEHCDRHFFVPSSEQEYIT